ncbi:RNA dependent RNA polymerase, partial [Cytobacillus praedii]
MQKQIFYTFKFKSSRLKEFNYDIQNLSFDEAKQNKEVISMFDSQLFRSIRHLNNKDFNINELNKCKKELSELKKRNCSADKHRQINEIQSQINKMLFVPEIISIVIENKSHYRYLFRNRLKLNGLEYRRLTCSAGQARSSVVIFCESAMADKLDAVFDNGRDQNIELVPSKFNAYKGLITSSTSTVSTPRFCLVPDYTSPTDVKVNYVTETDLNEDDLIEEKVITEFFNRFDGQGIISVEMATKWADELGLDYIPSQWCIRQNYIKGMLTTFDIKAFCEKENNNKYIIDTSYLDENGKAIKADLSKIDVIISESQFKLWNSFPSIDYYNENCEKNKLQWGISLISPKKDKDILKMNYQFLQTVKLNDTQIESLCKKTVDWLTGVTSKNISYTLLFLLGVNITEDKITDYLNNSENHWVKALMLDNELINDKWIKRKIYDLIKKKIKKSCLGEILVDGNFQVLVSDPFAMMQHACGQEVTGLLGKKEYYSNYWNEKGVSIVDSMRAPLTYRSEHVVLNLKKNEELDYWYKYNTSGVIVNIHGHETMNWAGSDFDFDIIATTSNENIINGVFKDELPITYAPPKSKAINFKERDLYNADLHSFGSEIGQITNKSTSGYALLAQLEENSTEYKTTLNRIKMCTKLQSAQIDKAKIGRKVKSIPNIWLKYNRINDFDSEEVKHQKKFL